MGGVGKSSSMEGKNTSRSNAFMLVGCFVAITILIIGMTWFGNAFFPRKVPLSGTAGREVMKAHHVEPQYDRLVVMVVDAMRADFLYDVTLGKTEEGFRDRTAAKERGERNGEEMHWTRDQLIAQGRAVALIGRAQAPTVTLPRVKALVSGSIPSFLDFVANFDSPSLKEDSIIRQLRAADKRLHFYGDDTWLKLFPPEDNVFSRYEGTTSFFVSDYIEVDQNVSRCLDDELSSPWVKRDGGKEAGEWDVLILHYLGLDHIGHYQGPRSPLMPPKLREMDDIVRKLWEEVLAKDEDRCSSGKDQEPCGTLLVLLGDHGMNEVGNHGGSSELETSTVLLLASTKLQDQGSAVSTVDQVDLVPTLAVLMGVPIPLNSLGAVIPKLLPGSPGDAQRLSAYRRNAEQLMRVLRSYPAFWDASTGQAASEEVSVLHDMYNSVLTAHDKRSPAESDLVLEEQFTHLLLRFKSLFINLLTASDTEGMVAGEFLILFSALLSLILICIRLVPRGLTPRRALHLCWRALGAWHEYMEVAAFGTVMVLYLVSMLTSSFVEEEHKVWYFLLPTLLIAIVLTPSCGGRGSNRGAMKWTAVCLSLHRLSTPWNQTGDKWIHLQDIGDWLEEFKPEDVSLKCESPGHALLLLSVCAPALVLLALQVRFVSIHWRGRNRSSRLFFSVSAALAACLVATYKIGQLYGLATSSKSSVWFQDWHLMFARGVFALIFLQALLLVITLFRDNNSIASPWRLSSLVLATFLMILHRPRNQMPLLMILLQFHALERLLQSLSDGPLGPRWATVRATLLFEWFGRAAHFILGGSNGFATIDISGAYTGLSGYIPAIVGGFSGLILFSGPLLSFLVLMDFLGHQGNSGRDQSVTAMTSIVMNRTMSVSVCSGIMIILRTHLFIWTVFSPRFMFEILEVVVDGLRLVSLLVAQGLL